MDVALNSTVKDALVRSGCKGTTRTEASVRYARGNNGGVGSLAEEDERADYTHFCTGLLLAIPRVCSGLL